MSSEKEFSNLIKDILTYKSPKSIKIISKDQSCIEINYKSNSCQKEKTTIVSNNCVINNSPLILSPNFSPIISNNNESIEIDSYLTRRNLFSSTKQNDTEDIHFNLNEIFANDNADNNVEDNIVEDNIGNVYDEILTNKKFLNEQFVSLDENEEKVVCVHCKTQIMKKKHNKQQHLSRCKKFNRK